jgi:hypothetical protein
MGMNVDVDNSAMVAAGSGDDVEMRWFRSSIPGTAGELFLQVGDGRVSDFCVKNLSW